jgi:amino acid transporter
MSTPITEEKLKSQVVTAWVVVSILAVITVAGSLLFVTKNLPWNTPMKYNFLSFVASALFLGFYMQYQFENVADKSNGLEPRNSKLIVYSFLILAIAFAVAGIYNFYTIVFSVKGGNTPLNELLAGRSASFAMDGWSGPLDL